jgi:hypothetical protein
MKYFILISPPFKEGPRYLPMYSYTEEGETTCGVDESKTLFFDTYNEAEKIANFLRDEYEYHVGVVECPENLS